ncbi:MAG TPA: DUF1614 domain-containing protein, partial [Candidatus Wildermuthbacteria bacterium]|nr:DUF1614 domain-containing protein [Candidatus Wildermuthbacteria bacterium]
MFVNYGKTLFFISMFFVAVSVAALAVFGLNVGGAVIPLLISLYLLTKVPLELVAIPVALMV